jgi:NADPH:quinone reductase-like Zn-dependent oxidoreductase
MKAVTFDRYGDESVLRVDDIPAPTPGADELQIQVLVASLNPVDFKLRAGLYRILRKPTLPAITGKDFAGRVTAVGASVRGFSVGQRVFGSVNPMGGRGSCAETVVIGTNLVAAIPDALGDETAASLPVASGTALQALVSIAKLGRGQSVLVTGASGAVGSSGVQIARSLGARVTGVCGTANVDYVRSLGVEEVVDYSRADWRDLGGTFDVIFDAAGVSTFGAARRHLAASGYYLNTFPRPGMFVTSPLVNLLSRRHSVPFMLRTDAALLQELARLAAAGVLKPRIARTIGLEGVAQAQKEMREGKVHGKVCVRIAT